MQTATADRPSILSANIDSLLTRASILTRRLSSFSPGFSPEYRADALLSVSLPGSSEYMIRAATLVASRERQRKRPMESRRTRKSDEGRGRGRGRRRKANRRAEWRREEETTRGGGWISIDGTVRHGQTMASPCTG